jgi:hypothetical protein
MLWSDYRTTTTPLLAEEIQSQIVVIQKNKNDVDIPYHEMLARVMAPK